MQENLKEKYNITNAELSQGIDILSKELGKICNIDVLLAVTDLLITGDIAKNASKITMEEYICKKLNENDAKRFISRFEEFNEFLKMEVVLWKK